MASAEQPSEFAYLKYENWWICTAGHFTAPGDSYPTFWKGRKRHRCIRPTGSGTERCGLRAVALRDYPAAIAALMLSPPMGQSKVILRLVTSQGGFKRVRRAP